MAEREGFEPPVRETDNGFQDRRIRPLCHLSKYCYNSNMHYTVRSNGFLSKILIVLFIVSTIILSFFFGVIILVGVIFIAIIRKLIFFIFKFEAPPKKGSRSQAQDNIIDAEYTIINEPTDELSDEKE
jgi:hypothetical protein